MSSTKYVVKPTTQFKKDYKAAIAKSAKPQLRTFVVCDNSISSAF